jgi:DNA topoisomerase VI subunit B
MTTLSKRKPVNKTFQRETFSTSRRMDFFSRKELTAQTGHQPEAWPLVALKELVDNALDACEDAGIAPKVAVKMSQDAIEVTDNGPGISQETISKVLDYSVRVSSREAYVSPTRGAQGNALKTLLAMAFVLHGQEGRVEIISRGIRHEITVRLEPIRQEPKIEHEKHASSQFVKNGTFVKLVWPDSACSILESANDRFLRIANDYHPGN